jgi:broad specificity phosphatase PhoE
VLTVILTRHGHTDRSEPDSYLGQRIAAQLTERGRRDAQALADRLQSVPLDRIIASPLDRSHETARILASGRDIEVELDARLAEFDYGSWEGISLDQVKERMPDQYALYDANPAIYHVGGGESGIEAARRAQALIDDMLAWWAGEGDRTCLLVGHSSINRALLAAVTGTPMADYRRRFLQDWVNLTVLRWDDLDGGPLLVLLNDLGHLRGTQGLTWG